LKEMWRVLKPGGIGVITTPNMAAWYNRLFMLFGYGPMNYTPSPEYKNIGYPRFVHKKNIYDHPRVFTVRALKELLGLCGFRIMDWDVINDVYRGQPHGGMRAAASYMIPRGWRENTIIKITPLK